MFIGTRSIIIGYFVNASVRVPCRVRTDCGLVTCPRYTYTRNTAAGRGEDGRP